jgi:transposase
MSRAPTPSTADLPSPSARRVPRSRRGDGWDALADIEVFVFAVEAELEAMDRERVGVHRRGRKPDLALRRRLIGLIWTLTFGGLQWRVAGWLSGIPFTTLHSAFARWTRLGLWRRLGQRLALDWRLAHGDEVLPSAVVVDSRSLRSAPTSWTRGIDGGKLVKGVQLFAVCDKHGSPLDLELQPANTDDRAGALPTLPRLAALGFQGDLLGDSGFKGAPFAAAALVHDIHVSVSPGGTRDGRSWHCPEPCRAASAGWWSACSPG